MKEPRRSTVYLEPQIHKALRLKSAETDQTISDLVNEALRHSLAEDAIDLEAIDQRKAQSERPFEAFVKELHKDGLV